MEIITKGLLKKITLSLLFLLAMGVFFLDFVSIKIYNTTTLLTGFDLLRAIKVRIGFETLNVWIVLAFVSGLAGFIISLFNGKAKLGLGFLVALGGVVFLLVAQFGIINSYAIKTNGLAIVSFKTAYWICLMAFVFAGSRCYLLQNGILRKPAIDQSKGIVNINIITQSNNANEK